jgi:hypothetical protein
MMGLCLAVSLIAAFAANEPITQTQNVNCGPPPPPNCRVGPCVCDQRGMNCRYDFICG